MRKEVIILGVILLFFFLSTDLVVAQGCEKFIGSECAELTWEAVRPGTGDVAEIVISPDNPNIMYTGMENNAHALYKSTNGGETWRRIDGPYDHTKDVAVSPIDPNKAYVAMSEGVHTTDLDITPTARSRYSLRPGVETQSILSSGRLPGASSESFSTVEVFEKDDKVIYAAILGGGASYGPPGSFGDFPQGFPSGMPDEHPGDFPDDMPGRPIGGDPTGSLPEEVTGPGGCKTLEECKKYCSSPDHAAECMIPPGSAITGHQVFDPSLMQAPSTFEPAKAKIFKTTNGGRSWISFTQDLGINVVTIHPTNPNVIYIGAGEGLYISRDSGKTIELLKKISDVLSVELQLDNPNVIYASSLSNVLKSIDSGNSWNDITGHLKDIHRVRVSRSNPNVLYASTFNGIFRSDNFGDTWGDVSGNLKAKNIQIVTIHPKNPNLVFVGTSTLWWPFRGKLLTQGLYAHQGIFKTMDGGKTWSRSDGGIFEYNIEEVKTNPYRPYEAWYAGQASRGGLKTIDGGHNWRQSIGSPLHYPMRIAFSPQNPDTMFMTTWGAEWAIAKSQDGGISWNNVIAKANSFFNGLNRGKSLYKPSGPQGQIHIHGFAIDTANENIMYAGSVHDVLNTAFVAGGFPLEGAHLFKSIDGGKTWQESDEGFPHEKHTAIHDIQIDPKNTNIIYVATTKHESESGIGIYKSIDAGKTWRVVNNGLGDLSVATIAIHPKNTNTLLAATHSGLYKSVDGGQSWKQTARPSSSDVEYVKESPDVVYTSTDEGVLKSRNFGETWYKVNYGLPEGHGQGIGVDITGNAVYAAVKHNGLYAARLVDIDPIEPVSVGTKGFALGGGYKKDYEPEEKAVEQEEIQEKVTLEKSEQVKEPKEEIETIEKRGIFDSIIDFFKRLFNISDKQPPVSDSKEVPQVEEETEIEHVGPGGCRENECQEYCRQNPTECLEWCQENRELCNKMMKEEGHEQFPSFPGKEFPERFPSEFPQGEFSDGGPPKTEIIFAKTVNFNADQFTEQDISKAKELGANMVTIWPSRSFKDDEYTFSFPERLSPMINFAYKNGLQVELRGSYAGDESHNYVKYKASAIEFVADFSKFAEKSKVYRIVPFGEIDNNMFQHCDKITALSQELLQEMRKHYSGQIGTGVVASWRDCGFNFEGYDYLTVSVYAQTQTGMDAWLTNEPEINLNNVIDWARTVADRSNIKILHIGETGVQNIGEKDPVWDFQTVEVNKEKEAEFYQKLFELTSHKVNGVSAFYNGKTSFLGINGDPAEEVVKEWYTNKLPE